MKIDPAWRMPLTRLASGMERCSGAKRLEISTASSSERTRMMAEFLSIALRAVGAHLAVSAHFHALVMGRHRPVAAVVAKGVLPGVKVGARGCHVDTVAQNALVRRVGRLQMRHVLRSIDLRHIVISGGVGDVQQHGLGPHAVGVVGVAEVVRRDGVRHLPCGLHAFGQTRPQMGVVAHVVGGAELF